MSGKVICINSFSDVLGPRKIGSDTFYIPKNYIFGYFDESNMKNVELRFIGIKYGKYIFYNHYSLFKCLKINIFSGMISYYKFTSLKSNHPNNYNKYIRIDYTNFKNNFIDFKSIQRNIKIENILN